MKFNFAKTKQAVRKDFSLGFDIGHGYCKLVLLALSAEGVILKNYFFKPISQPTQITAILKDLSASFDVPANKLNFSLSGKTTLVRDLWMPQMNLKELKTSIQYELDQYIPFPADDVYYDSYILPENQITRKEGQMRVILAVANKKIVEANIKLITQAGFVPEIIDMDALAIYNSFVWTNSDSPHSGTVAFVDLGASKTIIDIISDKILTFTREIEYGTNRIAEGVARTLSLGKDEADKLISAGDEKIEGWIQNLLSKMSKELWSSFEYYEGQEQKSIEKVYLAGGGSLLPNFPELLGQALGLPTEVWNPLKKIKYHFPEQQQRELEKISPLLTVACGLACRGL